MPLSTRAQFNNLVVFPFLPLSGDDLILKVVPGSATAHQHIYGAAAISRPRRGTGFESQPVLRSGDPPPEMFGLSVGVRRDITKLYRGLSHESRRNCIVANVAIAPQYQYAEITVLHSTAQQAQICVGTLKSRDRAVSSR